MKKARTSQQIVFKEVTNDSCHLNDFCIYVSFRHHWDQWVSRESLAIYMQNTEQPKSVEYCAYIYTIYTHIDWNTRGRTTEQIERIEQRGLFFHVVGAMTDTV